MLQEKITQLHMPELLGKLALKVSEYNNMTGIQFNDHHIFANPASSWHPGDLQTAPTHPAAPADNGELAAFVTCKLPMLSN